MPRLHLPALLAAVLSAAWTACPSARADEIFTFRDTDDRIEVRLGEQRIATYLKRHPQLTRRGLVDVTTPGGIQVTRNFPPRLPEDADPSHGGDGIDHRWMHPGIWIAYGNLDGHDYWRMQAEVQFDGYAKRPWSEGARGGFAVTNRYLTTDGSETTCIETSSYLWQRTDYGVLLRIDASYRSDRDFYFGDQEESGLAVRVATPIRVRHGHGGILDDQGRRNGRQVWGKQASWCDYFGVVDSREVGLMLVASPSNPRTSWLHARDYGLLAMNPFPKQPRERREPYVKTPVKRNEDYRLSWAVLIHDLPPGVFDRTRAYRQALAVLREDL